MNKIHLFNLKHIYFIVKLSKNPHSTRISNINTADKILIKNNKFTGFYQEFNQKIIERLII